MTVARAIEVQDATAAPEVAEAVEAPLDGFRIGVTSHRRSRDLIEALERRGASVLHAPDRKSVV